MQAELIEIKHKIFETHDTHTWYNDDDIEMMFDGRIITPEQQTILDAYNAKSDVDRKREELIRKLGENYWETIKDIVDGWLSDDYDNDNDKEYFNIIKQLVELDAGE